MAKKIGQGKEKVRVFLQENPDVANTIEQQLREKLIVKPSREQVIDDIVDSDEPALEEA